MSGNLTSSSTYAPSEGESRPITVGNVANSLKSDRAGARTSEIRNLMQSDLGPNS